MGGASQTYACKRQMSHLTYVLPFFWQTCRRGSSTTEYLGGTVDVARLKGLLCRGLEARVSSKEGAIDQRAQLRDREILCCSSLQNCTKQNTRLGGLSNR